MTLGQQVEIAEHDTDEIVEIMGETASQLADRLHLLCLAQLALDEIALPRVLDREEYAEQAARRIVERCGGGTCVDRSTVPMAAMRRLIAQDLACSQPSEPAIELSALLRQDQRIGPTEHLCFGIAEQVLGGSIP